MRTYLIYKEKARRWNADEEIQALVQDLTQVPTDGMPDDRRVQQATADALGRTPSTARRWARAGSGYERLDQLTIEVLLGVR